MKKIVLLLLTFFVLAGSVGCTAAQPEAPTLLEPVGVWLDSHQVQPDDIYQLTVYDGQIVPHVASVCFTADGKLGQMHVTLGQQVTKGQVLASLDTTAVDAEIKELEDEIAHQRQMGYYADRIQNATISILKAELAKMRSEGASELDCHLKELDIEAQELELAHQQQLRYFDIRANPGAIMCAARAAGYCGAFRWPRCVHSFLRARHIGQRLYHDDLCGRRYPADAANRVYPPIDN